MAGKYAACGSVVVQVDLDGGKETWFAMFGTMSLELTLQRTIKRGDIWARHMAVSRVSGQTLIHTENLGVNKHQGAEKKLVLGPSAKMLKSGILAIHRVLEEQWHLQFRSQRSRDMK